MNVPVIYFADSVYAFNAVSHVSFRIVVHLLGSLQLLDPGMISLESAKSKFHKPQLLLTLPARDRRYYILFMVVSADSGRPFYSCRLAR